MKSILKRKNKKGFTLMEMLIVIGIISILVAIAIPTFSSAQKKAKYAADVANVRAWYAEQLVGNMTDDKAFEKVYSGPALQLVTKDSVTIAGGEQKDPSKFQVTYTPKDTDKTDTIKEVKFPEKLPTE